jgi:hypothetical protein
VISFASPDKVTRVARLHTDEGVELHDFDALDSMVRETYELWHEVLVDCEETGRGTGTVGPMRW